MILKGKGNFKKLNEENNYALNRKNELKRRIIRKYVDLTEGGDSKELIEKFFLGFSKTEDLMLLEYNRKAMCILYDGDVEHTVNLLKLIISQIYANMSADSVNVRVVDTVTSGTRLSLFHSEDTGAVPFNSFDMWLNTEDTSREIKLLDGSLSHKNRTMLRTHNSIHDYNRHMLESDSVTEEYTFVILYNYDSSIFEGEEMRRMIINSYQYGIVPIILMDIDLAKNAESYKDDVNLNSYVRLFQALDDKNNYFFVGSDGNSRPYPSIKVGGIEKPINEYLVDRFRSAMKSN